MPFRRRVFTEILQDMIDHVLLNTPLTDFRIGSVIRTLLEAAALEDDEAYFQMAQLLRDFSVGRKINLVVLQDLLVHKRLE